MGTLHGTRHSGRIDRRTFLKVGSAAGVLAASGRAPAFAQPTKLHLLQWVDFIPEGDVELRRPAAEYSRQTKIEVTVETINANDLQARITAAIQSGTGADIIQLLHNRPHLYQNAWLTSPISLSGRPGTRVATTLRCRRRRALGSAGSPSPTESCPAKSPIGSPGSPTWA